MEHLSGVGVLDKAFLLLDAVENGATTLAGLTETTGLSRATAHRLATALEVHRLLERTADGRWRLGARLAPTPVDALLVRAVAVLDRLRDATGESAQLYRRVGEQRVCVAASELGSGLRDTVPVGTALPLTAGSAAQVLVAWSQDPTPPVGAVFSGRTIVEVRRRGWAHSVAEREQGVASVSAPVLSQEGLAIAAVSVSGPIDRMTRTPGRRHAPAVLAAATALSI